MTGAEWLETLVSVERKELARIRAIIKEERDKGKRIGDNILEYEKGLSKRISELEDDLHTLYTYSRFRRGF